MTERVTETILKLGILMQFYIWWYGTRQDLEKWILLNRQGGVGARPKSRVMLIRVYTNIFELYLSLRSNFYAIIYINKINFPLIQPLQFQSIRTILIAILSVTPLTMFIFSR